MEAERRQVTVLFTDMVGFTAFSERSGEEAAFTLMQSLSKLMGEAVREQGGVVQGFTGDGIMAVFGVPIAFEDAPLRACRSALAILQRLKATGGELEAKHGVRPQLRIGLNTGPAVVGQVEGGADAAVTVLGDTVNFAARLQALAEPSSVFMSEATLRLVQGMVDANFAGEHASRENPSSKRPIGSMPFARGQRDSRRRSAVVSAPLSDANANWKCWNARSPRPARNSALLILWPNRAWANRASCTSSANASARSVPLSYREAARPTASRRPFLPFIEVVRGSFRVSAGEAEKDVAQKLDMGLTALGLHSPRNLGLLLHLLGLTVPDGALTGLDGVLIGLRTRELLQQLLEARCRLSPVVMVIEDLHWVDSVSEELLGKIVDSESQAASSAAHHTPTGILCRRGSTARWSPNSVWSRFPLATSADWFRRGSGLRLCPRRLRGR